jgi:hypothetical protein
MEHQQPAAAPPPHGIPVSRSVHSTGSAQDEWSVTNKPMPEFKSSSNRGRLRKPWSVWILHENEEVYDAVV